MRWRSAALLVAVSALGACTVEDPVAVAGEYASTHEVFVFHGIEPVQVEVEDRLQLEAAPDELHFRLQLTSGGGEACEAEGVAAARRGLFEHRRRAADAEQGGPDCVLEIRAGDREIVVEDVGDRCREIYCEGRAAIGRTVFPRQPT